jgi:hypothetical protein
MVSLPMLWMPILLAAVLVFFGGFVLWMLLPLHKADYRGVPDEAAVADVLRRQNLAPWQYVVPWSGGDPKAMQNPEFARKMETGPIAYITIAPPGRPRMGRNLALYFLFALVVSVMVAYVAGRTLPAGTEYLEVFRLTASVAILAYGAAVVPGAIWFGKPWSAMWKEVFDGVVLGLLTAGAFGWLWPS